MGWSLIYGLFFVCFNLPPIEGVSKKEEEKKKPTPNKTKKRKLVFESSKLFVPWL